VLVKFVRPGPAPGGTHRPHTAATELGVGRWFVKDESSRLGLPAFKAHARPQPGAIIDRRR